MPSGISTFNKFMVGARAHDGLVVMLRPVPQVLSTEDAIILAAHLVSVADLCGERFQEYLRELLET